VKALLVSFASYAGVGVAAGIISGLFGIGGGILMVPAIIFIWGLEPKLAVGTSLAVMVPGAVAGVLRHHFSYQTVDWKIAAGLAIGAVLGSALIGAPLANVLPGESLKRAFGVLMMIFGLHMAGAFTYLSSLVH
jgi:uncharacterized membrane protein YfcA